MSPLQEKLVIDAVHVRRGYSVPGDTARAVKERWSPRGNLLGRLQDKSYFSRACVGYAPIAHCIKGVDDLGVDLNNLSLP